MQHLETTRLVVAEIGTIGDDDVVEEVDVHHFAGTTEAPCQHIIGLTGGEIA